MSESIVRGRVLLSGCIDQGFSFVCSVTMSRFALTTLSWSITALTVTPTSSPVFNSLVESQTVFVAQIMIDSKYRQKAMKLLKHFWNNSPDSVQKSLDAILNSASPTVCVLPLMDWIASYCQMNTSLRTIWTERKVHWRIIIVVTLF